jgi:glycosyltransferase involved in cell wall biosynthesis
MNIKIVILLLLVVIIGFLLYKLYFYKESFENKALSKKRVPIDVLIPCIPRDTDKLERVLKSIENQTCLPHRVIIAHSELNDNEASKIETTYENLPFKIIVNNATEKKYAGENRNRGFSSSDQPYISFFDADDEMLPTRLEEIMKAFNQNDSKCVMHLFEKNNLPNEYYNDKDIIKYISKNNSNNIDKNTNFSELRKNGYEGMFTHLHHGTPTIKREVFKKVKQSNNPRGQDQDFLFDVFEYFKNKGNIFTIINKPLQTYVPAKEQITKIETFQT